MRKLLIVAGLMLGCATHPKPLMRAQVEAMWRDEANALEWDKLKVAPLWSAKDKHENN